MTLDFSKFPWQLAILVFQVSWLLNFNLVDCDYVEGPRQSRNLSSSSTVKGPWLSTWQLPRLYEVPSDTNESKTLHSRTTVPLRVSKYFGQKTTVHKPRTKKPDLNRGKFTANYPKESPSSIRQKRPTHPRTVRSTITSSTQEGRRALPFLSDNLEDFIDGSGEEVHYNGPEKDTWSASLTTLPNVSPTSKIRATITSTTFLSTATEMVVVPEINSEDVFPTVTTIATVGHVGTTAVVKDLMTTTRKPKRKTTSESMTRRATTSLTTSESTTRRTTPESTTKRTTTESTARRTTPESTTRRTTPEGTTRRTTPESTPRRTIPESTTRKTTPESTIRNTAPESTTKKFTTESTAKKSTLESTTKKSTSESTTRKTTVDDTTMLPQTRNFSPIASLLPKTTYTTIENVPEQVPPLSVATTVFQFPSTTATHPMKIVTFEPKSNVLNMTDTMTELTEYQTSATVPIATTIRTLGKPLKLNIADSGPSHLYLEWEPPSGAPQKLEYMAIVTDVSSNTSRSHRITEHVFFNATNLKPFTLYEMSIRGFNGIWGEEATIKSQTAEGRPSEPRSFKVIEFGTSFVDWQWEEPINPNGRILEYIIRWQFEYERNDDIKRTNSTDIHIGPLKSNALYKFCVSASTQAGEGKQTCSSTKTAIAAPPVPQLVRTYFDGPMLKVSWEKPDDVDEVPRDCFVTVTSFIYNSSKIMNSKGCQSMPVCFTDLLPYTNYCVNVEARNKAGSVKASPTCLQTPPSTPSEVRNFRAQCFVTDAILKWEEPKQINGKLSQYILNIFSDIQENLTMYLDDSPQNVFSALDLSANTHYLFKISAITENVLQIGESVTASCTTTAAAPEYPSGVPEVTTEGVDGESQIGVNFNKNIFSDKNGYITKYEIIISERNEEEKPRRENSIVMHNVTWARVKSSSVVYPYATSPEVFNPFKGHDNDMRCTNITDSIAKCIIGCNHYCITETNLSKRCNGPLRSGTTYSVKIRAFNSAGYSDTNNVNIITESHVVVKVVIPVFTTLLIFACAIAIFFYLKRNRISLLSLVKRPRVEVQCSHPMDTINHANSTNRTTRPVKISEFKQHFHIMWCDSTLKFSQEFEELQVMSPTLPTTSALLSENRNKNRWVNILPFDHSRVKLLPLADDVTSDYINATYIPGYNSKREYIATQGPLPSTKDDFWRMVWEQSCSMIIMVTQCIERGKVKCEVYWPEDRETHYYGDIAIQMRSESILTNYTIRIFDMQLGSRKVEAKQMHFTMWPDFGCPENTEILLDFVSAVRNHMPHENTGPIIVHCSAGVGRTGTFIAIDRLIQHVTNHDSVDVFGTVLEMRQHRSNMVQTEDQYIYIHESIKDHLEIQNNKDRDGGSMKSNSTSDSVISNLTTLRSQDSQF